MKVLALDISTKAGWAVLVQNEDGSVVLGPTGTISKDKTVLEYGPYPECYRKAARAMADKLFTLTMEQRPDVVVIEETNPGGKFGNRYTTKLLEWIHLYFQMPWDELWSDGSSVDGWSKPKLAYISNNIWRQALGLKMSKDDKRSNEKLKKARKIQKQTGRPLKEIAAELGVEITAKVDRKGLSVRHVNERFGLKLKKAANDEAEAICLGEAYFKNAPLCDGDPNRRGKDE